MVGSTNSNADELDVGVWRRIEERPIYDPNWKIP